ncbi:MAG TPA: CBS domain-containing protein [Methylomirabilota bacterium]|nr:CBS domain-containing protein [Methylomirabilota bacterium]
MTARDLMTPDPITIAPDASISDAWDLMSEHDIRHVPVVQDGALVGMLSSRDLPLSDILRLLSVEGAVALNREMAKPVSKIMSRDVISVVPDARASDLVRLLLEHKVGAIPVVGASTGKLLGIVSYIDVLRALQDRLDAE